MTDCFQTSFDIKNYNSYKTTEKKWIVQTLEEIIDICVDNLYNDNENSHNITKHDFRNLLNTASKESYFTFNSKYYKQVDGVVMESPLDPALANMFICIFKSKWLRDCPNVFYRRYVMLMTYLQYILLLIKQINFRSICHRNIPT